jgi:hypothetical protein
LLWPVSYALAPVMVQLCQVGQQVAVVSQLSGLVLNDFNDVISVSFNH